MTPETPLLASQVVVRVCLFIVAAICIYLELAHPGAIVPGTVGVIALVLFLFGAGSLNPNWAGLVLMLLAIVLLAIDVRVPTHGVLTAGALVCLVVGSLIFFNSNAGSGGPTLSPLIIGDRLIQACSGDLGEVAEGRPPGHGSVVPVSSARTEAACRAPSWHASRSPGSTALAAASSR